MAGILRVVDNKLHTFAISVNHIVTVWEGDGICHVYLVNGHLKLYGTTADEFIDEWEKVLMSQLPMVGDAPPDGGDSHPLSRTVPCDWAFTYFD